VATSARPAGAKERSAIVLSDARSIKVLAHPARLAVLEELFAGRELTATEAAELVAVSPSAMSYHLRALQKAGIVERAEPSADGRERPWRALGTRIEVRSHDSPLTTAAGAVLATTVLERMVREFSAWMNRLHEEEPAWQDVSGLARASVWLDLEEAQELERAIEALIDRVRDRTAEDRPPGSRRMRLGVLLHPEGSPSQDGEAGSAAGSDKPAADGPA
jgi:DNA-binding transcriptional ArsR family regulator